MTSAGPVPRPPSGVPPAPDFQRGRSWKEAIKAAAKQGVRKAAGIAEPAGQVARWVSSRASPLSDYCNWAVYGVGLWYPTVPIVISVASNAASRVARVSTRAVEVSDMVTDANRWMNGDDDQEENEASEEDLSSWVLLPRKLTRVQCMVKMMDRRSLRVVELVRSMHFDEEKVQEILKRMDIDFGVTVDQLLEDGRSGEFYGILIRD